MPKRILKASLPHLNWMTKLVLILAIMVMSAVGALMLRLKKGPLDLDFAKAHIEKALSDKGKGYDVQIGTAQLIWPEVAAPLLVDLKGVEILQEEKTAIAVNEFAFSLSGLGILKGKILPSRIILNNPSFRLFKADGRFNNFWQGKAEVRPRVYGPIKPKDIRENIRDLLAKIVDPKNTEIETLAALKKVQIKNAVLQGKNEEGLALLNLSLNKHDLGLAGKLDVTYPEKQGKSAHFKSDLLYRRAQEDLTFTATLTDLHTSHIKPFLKDLDVITKHDLFLSGDLKAAFDKNLNLQLATLNLNMPESHIALPEIYDAPLVIKNFLADIYFNQEEKKLEIRKLNANIAGIPMEATLKGTTGKGRVMAPLELKISETRMEDFKILLPKEEENSALGKWVSYKLSEGKISNIIFTTALDIHKNPKTKQYDLDVNKPKASFEFEGMTVKYSPTLKPVTKAVGQGTYEGDALMIEASSGKVGDVVGRNMKLKISNLSVAGGGVADISLDATGSLKSALAYVSDKPISVGDELGFDVKNVKGEVNFNVQLNFPTVKDLPKEEVKVKLKGKVQNLLLPNVVRGLSLTGGPYDLAFKDGAITMKGKGKLAGRDIDLDWLQYLDSTGRDYESKIKAKIIADAELRKIFGIGLTDYVSGLLPVDVTYIDKGVKASIDVMGDLTPTTLHIDPFGYQKKAGIAGTLSLKAYLKGEDLKEVDNLKIDTKGFSISKGRLIFKKLKDGSSDVAQGSIPAVTLGKTRAAVDFEVTNENVLKVVANGSVVDMAPFLKTDKKRKKTSVPSAESQPMKISVTANKMLGDKGEALGKAKLYLELNQFSEPTRIEMDANVGQGIMSLRFKPGANGVRNFKMESTDAGNTLKTFGLYDKMRGGEIHISGQPKGGKIGGDLFGTAQINNFSIRKAPALAKLMSAMSVKGVEGLVANDGVSFSKLAANFEWKFKDDGNLLVLKEGRTSGNQLGLTFEGFVNMGTGITDISGTVIPLSSVNKAIGQIPVIGNILTGGGALFAATYSMKGTSNDPKVSINPLSVLAPGFVRKILFEGDVDRKVKKEENK